MKKLTTITTACLAAAAMVAISIADAEAGPQKKGKYGGNAAAASGMSSSYGSASIYPSGGHGGGGCKEKCPPRPKPGQKTKSIGGIFDLFKKEPTYKQRSNAEQRNGSRAMARGPNAQANATAWAESYAKTWIRERDGKKRGGGGGHGGGGYGGDSISSNNSNGGGCGGCGGGGGGHGGGGSSSSGTSAGASGGSSASASTGS